MVQDFNKSTVSKFVFGCVLASTSSVVVTRDRGVVAPVG